MQPFGFFELHFGAGAVAGLLGWVLEGGAAGSQEFAGTDSRNYHCFEMKALIYQGPEWREVKVEQNAIELCN